MASRNIFLAFRCFENEVTKTNIFVFAEVFDDFMMEGVHSSVAYVDENVKNLSIKGSLASSGTLQLSIWM